MRQTELRVGLIGFGPIGAAFALGVRTGVAGRCRLAAVLVRGQSLAPARAAVEPDCTVTADPEAFFGHGLDLVVEVAGQSAVRAYGLRTLKARADLMVTSVGALCDDTFRDELIAAAVAHGRRILVPSGAVIGLDGIAAAAVGRVDEVLHITRKPPQAWKGTSAEDQVDLDSLQEPYVLYEGTPRESAALYPANVNVQTAVALAGIGLDRTRVQVVADPTVVHNTHEIVMRGEFGQFRLLLENVPTAENPKTGLLTGLAVIKAVRNLTAPLVVGV